ncbi:unnamed protein product [Strongylus vulgaris]|uniref:Uncharacterized protein n=1 Tax=Strongylus vulgaris TaxID=40348 RepID=A0A3P7M0J1_STRVU|nr:unnamed protein product [Strongylus vulgaris]
MEKILQISVFLGNPPSTSLVVPRYHGMTE